MRQPHLAGIVVALALVGLLAGCGAQTDKGASAEVNKKAAGSGSPGKEDDAPAPGIERRIIYRATLSVQVENFSSAQDKLEELVDAHRGILEKQEIKGSPGTARQGTWKVRVPPSDLRPFRDAVLKLGEPLDNNLASDDVTEEYYDLAERIKSKEREIESYRTLYDKATTTLDTIAVKKELDRALGELDRFKGRQKLLRNLSDLTTVDITLRERGVYVAEETPGFGTRIGRVFGGSLDGLLKFGQFLLLCCVGVAPWLPVALVVSLPPYYWWRRRRKQRASHP
jgi:hypothetical protein